MKQKLVCAAAHCVVGRQGHAQHHLLSEHLYYNSNPLSELTTCTNSQAAPAALHCEIISLCQVSQH